METPVKHSASELRAMLKEHKASMPRLSAKKPQLMEFASKMGLIKAAAAPLPPSPPPEAPAPVELKKKSKPTMVAAPVSVAKKSELPPELKKPEAKKVIKKEAASTKKTFSDSAKGGLAAYASFVAEKKARGMSHKEAVAAWKNRK